MKPISLLGGVFGLTLCSTACQIAKLAAQGDTTTLLTRSTGEPKRAYVGPGIVVIALDGVGRDLLYDELRKGVLPKLSRLLACDDRACDDAYFSNSMLSTLPSTTLVAWATAFTGVPPAEHGVTGNEFFVRQTREFAAPVPTSFDDASAAISSFTEGYSNRFVLAPTLYERLRKREPYILSWVAMHPIYAGADKLLTTDRAVLADAMKDFLADQVESLLSDEQSMSLYSELDEEVVESVVEELEEEASPNPDVLTVYLVGIDAYTHVSTHPPDEARRAYLREVLEPQFSKLDRALRNSRRDQNYYVIVTADHGHTQVVADAAHALSTQEGDPPELLEKVGYRVRPFQLEVDDDDDFQAVLAYQGAMAYVYLADRSTCPKAGSRCDWQKPPRFEEDVVPLAEALYQANLKGEVVPELEGTLDMILTRRPVPLHESERPLEVYVGNGKLQSIAAHLERHPHPTYVSLDRRLRDLAAGLHGERAGDIVLIANNGNKQEPDERYYFSNEYRSWHGSPSRRDCEIPLIVSHAKRPRAEFEGIIERVLQKESGQQALTHLVLELRARSLPK